jgi:RNA polymerase sigma factor (TIGR02999 family)
MKTCVADITDLLKRWSTGDQQAFDEMLPLVYDDLKQLAERSLRQESRSPTLNCTALVHEAYLRLADQREVHWKNREQFLGVAAQLMRRVLVDYSRGHGAQKRGKGFKEVFLEEAAGFSKGKASDVIALDDALNRLAEFDPQQARLVEMRFFGGLSIEEAAGVMGVSRATVKRHWNLSKAWLARELSSGDE